MAVGGASHASDGSDGDQQQHQGQRTGRARAASRTPKDEILSLREDARAPERVVLRLERRRRDALDGEGDGGRVTGKWKRLAYDQSEQRAAAVHENKKLRLAMAECRQLAASLIQLTLQPTSHIQELGSMEDSEWRMNMLGHHQRRRHLNADRIMAQLRSKLAGWAIHSGFMDVSEETRFGRCENRDLSDRAMHLEVNVCREFSGHYVDVASAVWRYFSRKDIETSAAAFVRVETSEILGDRIRRNTMGIRMAVDGDHVGHATHQLSQRIEEDARGVIMWKAVTEGLSGASHRFAENADGWISFEKAVGPDPQAEKCLMKCSSMALVLPLGHTTAATN